MREKVSKVLPPLVGLLCLLPFISSGWALLLGVLVAISCGNPYSTLTKKWTHRLLTFSVMGLGAGMNLFVVAKAGMDGIVYTLVTLATAFLLGLTLGRVFGTARDTSILITAGTAICGGSAIAAVAPVLRAKSHEVSVALGIVFMLNACALFLFPTIGHWLNMSEAQFGLWSAVAIHDTSSVVGATMQYGAHALEVGTTIKLARSLWIIPMTFVLGLVVSRRTDEENNQEKPKRPWFILGFLAMAAIVTAFPSLQPVGHTIESLARRLLVVTLFLIGSNLTPQTLRSVGFRPFLQGIVLWGLMASGTLFIVQKLVNL
jgi:uncharacterized integral membrane protein (TIGR00698 family)